MLTLKLSFVYFIKIVYWTIYGHKSPAAFQLLNLYFILDEIFRDYVDKVHGDAETKAARLYSWFPNKLHIENISDTWPLKLLEIKEEIDRCKETSVNDNKNPISLSKPMKVFTTSHYVRDHLKSKDFVLVDNENDANILFLMEHFKDFGLV